MLKGALAARHGIVFAAPRRRRRREVALTFDDGPSPDWTPPLLDVLAEHGAHATFFVLGAAVEGNEQVLRRAVAEGHELGNHLFSHRDPQTLTDQELVDELTRTSALLERATGVRPFHFRPPYAGYDRRVAALARSAGMRRTVLRSVDPADWREPDAQRIADVVLREARRGSIVCLHDSLQGAGGTGIPSRQATVDAVAAIVPALHRRGFSLVTVRELLA